MRNLIRAIAGNIFEKEESHMTAKIQNFLNNPNGWLIHENYYQNNPLKRVSVIRCVKDSQEIYIRRIQEIHDGILYETLEPETIYDLKIIENETKKNQTVG